MWVKFISQTIQNFYMSGKYLHELNIVLSSEVIYKKLFKN